MQHLLQDMVVANLFAFLLVFMRLGMAMMVMPGIGDSFVNMQTRLMFALAMSFVLTPFMAMFLPTMPGTGIGLAFLLMSEAFIGLFIGTSMRILLTALDMAGAIVSIQAGFSNAMIFNPVLATPGTITGGLYSLLGVTLLFVTDLDHNMLASVVESYKTFPADGRMPDMGSFSAAIAKVVTMTFRIGIQMSAPFLVVGTLIQLGFGLLGRLMPQLQVFFLAMPLQIFLSLIILAMTLSVCMLYWLDAFQGLLSQSLIH